jgi:hypothetical protein
VAVTVPTITVADVAEGSPQWWVRRLYERLQLRQTDMRKYRQLVDDEHAIPLPPGATPKFAEMAALATTNLTGLVVEATAERMSVEGFRFGEDPDADRDAWRMWQASDFDAGSEQAITDALIYGRGFISVDEPGEDGQPRFYAEDPRQVYVAYSGDGRRRRVAALKVFTDDWTGRRLATLYLPDYIVRFEDTTLPGLDDRADPAWDLRTFTGQESVTPNAFGEVPIFELQNKPLGRVRSEVANLEVPQYRLNKLAFRTDVVAEYGAFRQKWAIGVEVPRDEDGVATAPWDVSAASILVAEQGEARFGDFNATDLSGYLAQGREIAAHMARISRVPVTYFLTDVANLSAEALALLVSGLVKKCQRRVKGYEPAFEGAMRLAFKALGDPRAQAVTASTKWAKMETQSLAQAADAATKLVPAGVIAPQTAQEEFLGMDQTQRDRDAAWRSENDTLGTFTDLLNTQAAGLDADALGAD